MPSPNPSLYDITHLHYLLQVGSIPQHRLHSISGHHTFQVSLLRGIFIYISVNLTRNQVLNNKRNLRPGGTYGKPVFRLMTKTVTVAPPVSLHYQGTNHLRGLSTLYLVLQVFHFGSLQIWTSTPLPSSSRSSPKSKTYPK